VQIEIDFEVFKSLTNLRLTEADSYNAVIRRLLNLPNSTPRNALSGLEGPQANALAPFASTQRVQDSVPNALLTAIGGAWFGNTHFPEGTLFRATYKGQTFSAEVKNGLWIGQDGITRTSPSEAAGAISGTNVNGWRFWHAKRPGDPSWKRMDEFKQ
jgi:hypothetical protein